MMTKEKKDFKQTEVGLIPEDWDLTTLSEIGSFSKGKGIRKSEVKNEGIPCIRYGELYTRHHDLIHEFYSFIDENVAKQSRKLYKGDILFAGSGETKKEIGKSVAFNLDVEAYAGGDIVILSPSEVDSKFLGYALNSEIANEQKYQRAQGDAVVHIYSSSLSNLKIPLPPTLEEQQAIASALSDVDELIRSLDGLIAKKEAIKKGTMQQLLSGKKRLPGFDGDWEVKKIGDIASINTGAKNTEDKVEDGKYPFFVRSSKEERINTYSFDGEAVLTAGDGVGTGKIFHYVNGKFDYHQRVYKMSDFASDVDGYYFYLYFSNYFYDRVMGMTAKSSVDSVRMDMIAEMEINLPPLVEQKAIAHILSDMDEELSALRRKREKMQRVKEGMMQELLTGRVRLV